MCLPFLTLRTRSALSSPESTSPALIGLPAFGAGSDCWAKATGAAEDTAKIAAKANRMANRRFVMCVISVSGLLEQGPLPHRSRQRAFIEIIEFAADRHAMGEPRHLDVRPLQEVGDVVRRGLVVDGGVEGEDD